MLVVSSSKTLNRQWEKVSPARHKQLLANARTLERRMTEAEKSFILVVEKLRKKLPTLKCQRQKIFHFNEAVSFIADFYFPNLRVAVELDGGSHYGERQRERDKWRDGLFMEHYNVLTLRFPNRQVITKSEEVLLALLDSAILHPHGTWWYRKQLGFKFGRQRTLDRAFDERHAENPRPEKQRRGYEVEADIRSEEERTEQWLNAFAD